MKSKEQVLEKIKKLLTLVDGTSSDAEANAAFQQAQKLMAKHQLEMAEVKAHMSQSELAGEEIISVNDWSIKAKSAYVRRLASIIAVNFRCNSLITRAGRTSTITFQGYESDAEAALFLFQTAMMYMKRRQDYYHHKHYNTYGVARGIRQSYATGFVDGISKAFKEMAEEMISENSKYALVVQVPKEVKALTEDLDVCDWSQEERVKNAQAYNDGRTDGSLFNRTVEA